jgi:inosine-uridine nucleoside N-ribohydrolase
VVAGYPRSMPAGAEPWPPLTAVHQGDVAPTEEGLPPPCPLSADELIAQLARQRPQEVYLLTIGSLTNVGRALIRFPEAAAHLKGIITNGGGFRAGRDTTIGWNLRYDPVASATVARSNARWVLLSEGTTGPAHLTAEDVQAIQARGLETTEVMMTAIRGWRKNKRECKPTSVPHVSDLNVLAYLLGYVKTYRGRAYITVGPPDRTAELRIEEDPQGPHTLGWELPADRAKPLHDLFVQRLLDEPIAAGGSRVKL